MKRIFFSALAIFSAGSPALSMVPVKAEHFAYFKEAIQVMGFRCDTSDGGYAVNPAHIGGDVIQDLLQRQFIGLQSRGGRGQPLR